MKNQEEIHTDTTTGASLDELRSEYQKNLKSEWSSVARDISFPHRNTKPPAASFLKKNWWETFEQRTSNFTEPCVIEDVMNSELVSKLRSMVRNVFLKANPSYDAYMRTSLGGKINRAQNQLIYKNPPIEFEHLEDWVKSTFDQEFGIVLNSCQEMDEDIKAFFIDVLKPFTRKYGLPIHGFDITLFMGNYGFTPFGFHKDPIGHQVFHFHLGPEVKQMYLLPKSAPGEELINRRTDGEYDYDFLIPQSEQYDLRSGDVFFMPEGRYHVGRTDEFSIGLTLWETQPSNKELMFLLLKDVFNEILETQQSLLDQKVSGRIYSNGDMNTDLVSEVIDPILSKDQELLNKPIKELLKSSLLDRLHRTASNGVFRTQGGVFNIPDLNYQKEKNISLNPPFQLIYKKNDEFLQVFIKGYRFEYPYSENLTKIIDKLNNYDSIGMKAIEQNLGGEISKSLLRDLHLMSSISMVS